MPAILVTLGASGFTLGVHQNDDTEEDLITAHDIRKYIQGGWYDRPEAGVTLDYPYPPTPDNGFVLRVKMRKLPSGEAYVEDVSIEP